MKRTYVQAMAALDLTRPLFLDGLTCYSFWNAIAPSFVFATSLRSLRRKTRKAEATGQWRAVGEPELLEFPARSDARFWRLPAED